MTIHVTPIGKTQPNILKDMSRKLKKKYSFLSDEIKVKSKLEVPSRAYDPEQKQYRAGKMLEYAKSKTSTPKEGKLLAITSKDLYSGNLNFVFGQARCPGKACIVSLHRLRPEFYGQEENNELYVARATKEAAHELGHTFGLRHCTNPKCVMTFSNSIVGVDRKELKFCEDCRKKLGT